MARDSEPERRLLTHAMTFGIGGMLTLYAGKQVAHTVVAYKWMAKDIQALAAVEIDLSEVPEGKTKTFEWRGKPIFVRHRTSTEIAREQAVVIDNLRHPQSDSDRVQKDEWSVLIGVCTHLGCVPIGALFVIYPETIFIKSGEAAVGKLIVFKYELCKLFSNLLAGP